MALVRRFLIIVFGFFCVFTVLFLGDKIQSDLLDRRIDRTSKYNPVYRPYALWEESQLFENPNYDNLSILVEIDNKLLYLIDTDTNKVIKKYVVATGTSDTPTPIGTYKIVQKGKWGTGFGTRWIGINVPWGRYGIHGTNKPSSIGYNASHGCIRMRNKDVEENGIALCLIHHKLFDRDVFTIDKEMKLLVAQEAHGSNGFEEWIMRYHNNHIRVPIQTSYIPRDIFVKWHQHEVFRGPARNE